MNSIETGRMLSLSETGHCYPLFFSIVQRPTFCLIVVRNLDDGWTLH
jgi:hypothetical protein